MADKAADVAAGAIAEAVVAANGGVPRRLMDKVERDARPAAPAPVQAVEALAKFLKEFAASSPDVDIRTLLPQQVRPAPRLRMA